MEEIYNEEKWSEYDLPKEYVELYMKNKFAPMLVDNLLHKRILDLEYKVLKKNKREQATRAQKMLILEHLGILDQIRALDTHVKDKADLLSILIDADADNIEKDLSKVSQKSSDLKTESNYKYLEQLFKKIGLKEDLEKIQFELNEIYKTKK